MTSGKNWAFIIGLALSAFLAAQGTQRVMASSSTPPPARGLGATAPNPVAPIVKQMKAAQTRLKDGDTGPETRGIQEQVVHDLEKLIDAASRQSSSNRGSRKSPSEGKSPRESENGSPQPSQASQRGGADGASARTGGAAPDSRRSTGKSRPVQITGQRSLLREVWGHLPPAMREHVRVDFSETVLPAYDELVRRYFEALLEEPQQRGAGRPAANSAVPLPK